MPWCLVKDYYSITVYYITILSWSRHEKRKNKSLKKLVLKRGKEWFVVEKGRRKELRKKIVIELLGAASRVRVRVRVRLGWD